MHPAIHILYEDDDLLFINKPAGMPVHPLGPGDEGTAAQVALEYLPGLSEVRTPGSKFAEAGLLHRLDTGTSGALGFAKRTEELLRLRELWSSASVKKVYRAIVSPLSSTQEDQPPWEGNLPYLFDAPVAHSSKSSKKMIAFISGRRIPKIATRGKKQDARTLILKDQAMGNNSHDLTIQIETGVRHQIRVHLAAHGFPIVGDITYKGHASARMWLHSWKLALPKKDGSTLMIEAPLPENW